MLGKEAQRFIYHAMEYMGGSRRQKLGEIAVEGYQKCFERKDFYLTQTTFLAVCKYIIEHAADPNDSKEARDYFSSVMTYAQEVQDRVKEFVKFPAEELALPPEKSDSDSEEQTLETIHEE